MCKIRVTEVLPEGYVEPDREEQDAWSEVVSAYRSRDILQVEAKGVRLYGVDGVEIPCLQVQLGNVFGIVPANEAGVKGVPGDRDELAGMSPAEKREVMRRIERKLVGLPVWVVVFGIDREHRSFVASRRRALEVMAPRAWEKIEVGAVLPATVRELYPKRAVLDLGGVEAEMYAHEMSWGWTEDARDLLKLGRTYSVKVIKADREKNKVEVSLKQAQPSPWPSCLERYAKGGVYAGTVSGVLDGGVLIELEPGVAAFAPHPKYTPLRKGDRVKVLIVNIKPEKQRIYGRVREKL